MFAVEFRRASRGEPTEDPTAGGTEPVVWSAIDGDPSRGEDGARAGEDATDWFTVT